MEGGKLAFTRREREKESKFRCRERETKEFNFADLVIVIDTNIL
jgi:hypothetical protein